MTIYLFCNVLGSFLFDSNGKIIKKSTLSPDKVKVLAEGAWLNEEKNLIKGNEDVVCLNLKEKYDEVTKADFTDEKVQAVYEKIMQSFKKKENFNLLFSRVSEYTAEVLRTLPARDMLVIQSINAIDEIDKSINMLSTRLRERYSLYHPELTREITDQKAYAQKIISGVTKKESIGMAVSKDDLIPIKKQAEQVFSLYEFKEEQEVYLENMMREYCPNLSAVATEMIAARLLAFAGSLKRLMLFPASTIQTLGAEKAMFRHLKTGDRPPKYGIIVLHPLVNAMKRSDKGHVARSLASKISLAAKIDYFGTDDYRGYEMREELEKHFRK
jgi:nucleolar protein 56